MRFSSIALAVITVGMLGAPGPTSGTAATSSEASFTLPADPQGFPPGRGSQIASTYCLICHSAEYVSTQPPLAPDRWREIVMKMKHTFGCPIPDEQITPLVEYLASRTEGQREARLAAKAVQKPFRETRGDPTAGKEVYEMNCIACHGKSGKGDGPIGRSLVPPAADLTSKDVREDTDEELLGIIRNGAPPSAMPPWGNSLSPEAIHDVLAYIRSLSP